MPTLHLHTAPDAGTAAPAALLAIVFLRTAGVAFPAALPLAASARRVACAAPASTGHDLLRALPGRAPGYPPARRHA